MCVPISFNGTDSPLIGEGVSGAPISHSSYMMLSRNSRYAELNNGAVNQSTEKENTISGRMPYGGVHPHQAVANPPAKMFSLTSKVIATI